MDKLNLNYYLDRQNQETKFIEFLHHFEENKKQMNIKRGIYVYGSPGSGKSYFVESILKKLNYDVLKYDAGDVRNKGVIDTITKNNMSDKNILSLFNKKIKKIAIVMDEIDGMNSGDKGGINTLIKLIRPKKTKKQKKENITMIPIICIGNYHIDKKIKEMMKVAHNIELPTPTEKQITRIIKELLINLDSTLVENIIRYVNGDLRKINSVYNIYLNQQSILKNKLINNIFQPKYHSEDTKEIAKNLINNSYSIDLHNSIINETDRTSVGLLFHENIVDTLTKKKNKINIPFYMNVLKNINYADYIDRITFQKQIWVFNEMSSLIKTMHNNYLLHKFKDEQGDKVNFNPKEVRFTKVLTKYSTEYNNQLFIQNLTRQLSMDKKDLIGFFISLRKKYDDEEIYDLFDNENYNISKLDINRMYRFIDNYTKQN
jgi:hypothetical protein